MDKYIIDNDMLKEFLALKEEFNNIDKLCDYLIEHTDEIEKPTVNTSSNGKDVFINGIGKNGDELISLFEINSILDEKDIS